MAKIPLLYFAFRRICHQIASPCKNGHVCKRHLSASTRLESIGVLTQENEYDQAYETGQVFVHKAFGYRGVILFPWLARVYDHKDASSEKSSNIQKDNEEKKDKINVKRRLFYQVLMDSRDHKYVEPRLQTDAVTYLGNSSKDLTVISGMDYVSHEDVVPYTSSEKSPIDHRLYEKLLAIDDPDNAREKLREHPWMRLSDVFMQTTENIRVSVIPFYIGCGPSEQSDLYMWRYCVRLENLGEEQVQLRDRHWYIFSLGGTIEEVRGNGVVGKQPILSKDQRTYQYSSHVSLQAQSGYMWGRFRMERKNGTTFDCRIPQFHLESNLDYKWSELEK